MNIDNTHWLCAQSNIYRFAHTEKSIIKNIALLWGGGGGEGGGRDSESESESESNTERARLSEESGRGEE